MASDSAPAPIIPQFEINTASAGLEAAPPTEDNNTLLRQILTGIDRQNELLEELVSQTGANQKQRMTELGQWKQANPELANNCRQAAEVLGRVQAEFLQTLTREAIDNSEALIDGEFMLTEFIDRFGPRMAHLSGMLQVLGQLSGGDSNEQQRR